MFVLKSSVFMINSCNNNKKKRYEKEKKSVIFLSNILFLIIKGVHNENTESLIVLSYFPFRIVKTVVY